MIIKLLKPFLVVLVLLGLNVISIAQQATVVINEIYFDLSPTIGLPAVEYVELYNNSAATVNLNGWSFKDTGQPKTITEDFQLMPNGYVLLTKPDNVDYLKPYGSVIGLSSFPSLNDTGDNLTLANPIAETIHEVFYLKSWLNSADKSEGGWALELIDPDYYCGLNSAENWAASIDPKGGTPGALNSVDGSITDEIAPQIKSITVVNSNSIEVNFTESIELPALINLDNYEIISDFESFKIRNIFQCNEDNDCISIEINESFQPNTLYSLLVSNLLDCAGNIINKDKQQFVKPGLVEPFNIIINEILYAPNDDIAEYIELYNKTDKLFDLNSLNIQDLKDTVQISTNKSLLLPNAFALLTTDTTSIKKAYAPPASSNLVQVENLPSLNNSENDDGIFDVIRLANSNFSIIDSVQYSDDWHFRLLSSTKGVALERISFDKPAQEASNWQSASKEVNFGTPGYQNSQNQQAESQIVNEIINIENKTVSPDNDGFEDFLIINYNNEKSGTASNIYIFNEIGQLIAHPIKNELLGNSGTFKWDGLDDAGARIPLGIYIVYAEFFDLEGNINKQKIPVIVAGKL